MSNSYMIIGIAIASLVTAALRFAPFVIFSSDRKTPEFVLYLGKVLPQAIMAMLVVYCLKGMSFKTLEGFVPSILSCLVVVGVHVAKRNTLLSILSGTIVYMVLVQLIF